MSGTTPDLGITAGEPRDGWFDERITGALHSFLAEGAVAEVLYQDGARDVEWVGQQRKPYDVATDSLKVDAKFAFVHAKRLPGHTDPTKALGFMASTSRRRDGLDEAREVVTHYGLVLLKYADLGIVPGPGDHTLGFSGSTTYCVVLVPRELVNTQFSPADRIDGSVGLGANVYADLDAITHHADVRVLGDHSLLEDSS